MNTLITLTVILLTLVLTGCDSSKSTDTGSDLNDIGLTTVLSAQGRLSGYLAGDQLEIFFGDEQIYFKHREDDWQSLSLPQITVYSGVMFTTQHWLFSVAGENTYENGEFTPLLETTDGGESWSYRSLLSDTQQHLVVSGLNYHYASDQLYAAVGGSLGLSEDRGSNFVLESPAQTKSATAAKLVKHPARDELWWIGAVSMVSGGGTPDDALVRRYKLGTDGSIESFQDLTDEVGLNRVHSGLVSSADANRIYIAGNDGIVRSDDGGTNWTQVAEDNRFVNVLEPESGTRLITAFSDAHNVYVMCSENGGSDWTENTLSGHAHPAPVTLLERSIDNLLIGLHDQGVYQFSISQINCT